MCKSRCQSSSRISPQQQAAKRGRSRAANAEALAAQALLRQWLNNITVGSKVESVFGFRHENACPLKVGEVDCEFTSPNGVRDTGFETFVGTVVADADTSANVAPPYGVKLGEARGCHAREVAKRRSRWNEMDDVVLSIDDFEGAEGWTYSLHSSSPRTAS